MSLELPTSSESPTAQLEASFKATLHSLSFLLSFYNSLQALNASQYAARAPQNLTNALRSNAKQFEMAVDEIEKRVRRAIAVLERDLRKEQGVSPLPVPTPAAEVTATEEVPPAAQLDTKPAEGSTMDLDDTFLHTSLFGDSTAPSPMPESLGLSLEGLDATAINPNQFLDSLTSSSSAITSTLTNTSGDPDLDAIFAMVNSYPVLDPTTAGSLNLPGSLSSTATSAPADLSTMGDFDLSSLGLDFSSLDSSSMDFGNPDLLASIGQDVGGFGSESMMSSDEMNKLLESLGGGAST